MTAGDFRNAREFYGRVVQTYVKEEARGRLLVDKLPLNIVDLPLINAVFPDARVIVAIRDPRDVCLSCFMQEFRLNAAMINFLSWERTAEFYAKVMALYLQMRNVLTIRVIEVRYEDTVADLEAQGRRIVDHLGLEWDEALLSFHERARERLITTPSFAAVTEKVHSRAIGKWKPYARHFERVLPRLQPFIEAFGYS